MEWLKRYFSVSKGAAMAMLIVGFGVAHGTMRSSDPEEAIFAATVWAAIFFILGGLIEGFRQWRRDRKASRAQGGHPPEPAPYR